MSAIQFSICIFLIGSSAFLSGSEVALFSLSRFQLRLIKDRFKSVHRKVRELLSDPPGFLLAILLTNELVNITLSSIIAETISRELEGHENYVIESVIATLVITAPIVLILCEMTPKALGTKLNLLITPVVAHPIHLLYRITKPIRWILFPRRDSAKQKLSNEQPVIQEEEFITLVEQGHIEGSVEKTELELIKNVFELDDTPVSEILIPLSKVYQTTSTSSLEEASSLILSSPYSRIPVVQNKEIIGILYKKDLILDPEFHSHGKQLISEWMRSPLVVSPDMQINTLFRLLRQSKTHMAVVSDQKTGKTLGIVTMKDVLTELFEDILS